MPNDPKPAAPTEVHVRMYRALQPDPAARSYQGLLGDCFLIRLKRRKQVAHILIDCGMLLGSPDAQARMAEIAADIIATCGGDLAAGKPGTLDLVVVTHEHWDHLSGFSQAADLLLDPAKLAIGKVWLAWTEKPGDEQAGQLRARFDRSGAAFAALAERLHANPAFGADAAQRTLYGLEGFLGLAASDGSTPGTPARLAGRDVIEALRRRDTDYLEPGAVVETPGAVSLRTYVLGPPRDEKRLFKDRPSAQNPETYLDAPGVDMDQVLRFAAGADPDPSKDSPFAASFCRHRSAEIAKSFEAGKSPDGETEAFIRTAYFGDKGLSKAERSALDRRRIDGDWLAAAGALALKLDSDTNNTSLVLAFELPDAPRSILLFAADAQVGNWLSWHDQSYAGESAADLLGRTLLYKVGHHGSHNATLQDQGLAMMTRDDLFALIPTDEVFGKAQGSKGWKMPDPRLYAALRERSGGRILRNDRCYGATDRANDPELKDVDPAFFARLTETPLFLEYRVL